MRKEKKIDFLPQKRKKYSKGFTFFLDTKHTHAFERRQAAKNDKVGQETSKE